MVSVNENGRTIVDIVKGIIDERPHLAKTPASKADVALVYAILGLMSESAMDQALLAIDGVMGKPMTEPLAEFRQGHSMVLEAVMSGMDELLGHDRKVGAASE